MKSETDKCCSLTVVLRQDALLVCDWSGRGFFIDL